MAKQSSTITVNGKLGNIVGMKGRNGRSNARIKVIPKNPKTEQQSIQRVIFASVTKSYSFLKSICDHSFEGISYGQMSQEHFMKLNLDKYRSYFAKYFRNWDPEPAFKEAIAFWGGDNDWCAGVGAVISQGSLPAILPIGGVENPVQYFGVPFTADTNISTILAALNLQKGDQITVVMTAGNGDAGVPSTLFKSRYVINADAEAADLNVAWNAAGTGNAYDAERTNITAARLNATANGFQPVLVGEDDLVIEGAAIIVSREVGTKWERSNATLVNMWDEHPMEGPDNALAQYMAGGSTIDTLSDRYLNNADRLGE